MPAPFKESSRAGKYAAAEENERPGTGDILWMPGGEHGERDFPKVAAPPLDPDNRKKEW